MCRAGAVLTRPRPCPECSRASRSGRRPDAWLVAAEKTLHGWLILSHKDREKDRKASMIASHCSTERPLPWRCHFSKHSKSCLLTCQGRGRTEPCYGRTLSLPWQEILYSRKFSSGIYFRRFRQTDFLTKLNSWLKFFTKTKVWGRFRQTDFLTKLNSWLKFFTKTKVWATHILECEEKRKAKERRPNGRRANKRRPTLDENKFLTNCLTVAFDEIFADENFLQYSIRMCLASSPALFFLAFLLSRMRKLEEIFLCQPQVLHVPFVLLIRATVLMSHDTKCPKRLSFPHCISTRSCPKPSLQTGSDQPPQSSTWLDHQTTDPIAGSSRWLLFVEPLDNVLGCGLALRRRKTRGSSRWTIVP